MKIKADRIADLEKFGFMEVVEGKLFQKDCGEHSKLSILEISASDRIITGYAKIRKRARQILSVKRLKQDIKDLLEADMVEVEE